MKTFPNSFPNTRRSSPLVFRVPGAGPQFSSSASWYKHSFLYSGTDILYATLRSSELNLASVSFSTDSMSSLSVSGRAPTS